VYPPPTAATSALSFTIHDGRGASNTIHGFQPLGFHLSSHLSSIVMIRSEDTWEPWETDILFNTTKAQRIAIIAELLAFLTITEHCQPSPQWFVADIDARTGASNCCEYFPTPTA